MVTAIEAITSQARAGLCFILGQAEAGAGFVSRTAGTSLGAYGVASGLRRQLCGGDPEDDPEYIPPFEGGQCNEVYVVTISVALNGGAPSTLFRRARGPIRGVVVEPSGTGFLGVYLLANGMNSGTQDNCGPVSGNSPNRFFLASAGTSSEATAEASIISITPCGLDNCGNVPPVLVPVPIEYPTDITYNIDDSTEITIPTLFIFAPVYVDIDGSLRVPVNIDVGGVEFNGNIEIAPQFEINIKPAGATGGPGTPDDPDEIGEPGEPSDPIPEEEELESTIVGVLVYSDIDPDGMPSGILFPTGPDIYVPRLASVQFAVKTQNSIGWTPDQDVKNLECYVPCPAPQGAIAVRVSPMPGVTSRFTPVRGLPLTSF